jgi:hypothetical protein
MSTTKPSASTRPWGWSSEVWRMISSASHRGQVEALVEPRRPPRRQPRASFEQRRVGERGLDVTQPGAGVAGDPGEAQQPVGRRAQDLVLGDVGAVLVVAHVDRDGEAETPAELLLLTNAAADHGEGVVDLVVTLQRTLGERRLHLAEVGVGHRGDQVVDDRERHRSGAPTALGREAEQEQDPVNRDLRPDAQDERPDADHPDLAPGEQRHTGGGPVVHVDELRGDQRVERHCVDVREDGLAALAQLNLRCHRRSPRPTAPRS